MSKRNQINPNDQVERRRFWRQTGAYALAVVAILALLGADVCEAGPLYVDTVDSTDQAGLQTVETHTKPDAPYLLLRPNPVQRCICWLAKGLEGYLGRCACERILPTDPTIPPPTRSALEAAQ